MNKLLTLATLLALPLPYLSMSACIATENEAEPGGAAIHTHSVLAVNDQCNEVCEIRGATNCPRWDAQAHDSCYSFCAGYTVLGWDTCGDELFNLHLCLSLTQYQCDEVGLPQGKPGDCDYAYDALARCLK